MMSQFWVSMPSNDKFGIQSLIDCCKLLIEGLDSLDREGRLNRVYNWEFSYSHTDVQGSVTLCRNHHSS